MRIVVSIKRYNPEKKPQAYTQEFSLDVKPTDRVLDVLVSIKENQDSSLTFRKSCAHGVCGSDAMIINGQERLACKTLVKDVAQVDNDRIEVEPLRSMPIQRDLAVDQGVFFDNYRKIDPFLRPKEKPPKEEYRQSQKEREQFEDPTKCILCSACYSSCPVIEAGEKKFVGPAASAQAARFAFDTRDVGIAGRLEELDTPDGVAACDNHFNCTKVCPRGIKITKNINTLKKSIKKHKES